MQGFLCEAHTFTEAFERKTKDIEGCGMQGHKRRPGFRQTGMGNQLGISYGWEVSPTKRRATKRALGEDSLKFSLQVSGHTSCGRTSGRVCYTPQPAVEALCPHSSRRWTPPGGFDWDTVWHVRGNGGGPALPFHSRMRGKGKPSQSKETPDIHGSKADSLGLGGERDACLGTE